MRLAGALEQASEHLVGRGITAVALEELRELPPVTEFVAMPGLGARGTVDGHLISIGKRELFFPGAVTTSDPLAIRCAAWEATARQPCWSEVTMS